MADHDWQWITTCTTRLRWLDRLRVLIGMRVFVTISVPIENLQQPLEEALDPVKTETTVKW